MKTEELDWRAGKTEAVQMIATGYRAAMWLINGSVGVADRQKLIYDLCNAADCLKHPELFAEVPAIPAKKAAFIQQVAKLYADDPGAPERGLP